MNPVEEIYLEWYMIKKVNKSKRMNKKTIKNIEILVTEIAKVNSSLNEIISILHNQNMNYKNERTKVQQWLERTSINMK